jgi:hypothetical protein
MRNLSAQKKATLGIGVSVSLIEAIRLVMDDIGQLNCFDGSAIHWRLEQRADGLGLVLASDLESS